MFKEMDCFLKIMFSNICLHARLRLIYLHRACAFPLGFRLLTPLSDIVGDRKLALGWQWNPVQKW